MKPIKHIRLEVFYRHPLEKDGVITEENRKVIVAVLPDENTVVLNLSSATASLRNSGYVTSGKLAIPWRQVLLIKEA